MRAVLTKSNLKVDGMLRIPLTTEESAGVACHSIPVQRQAFERRRKKRFPIQQEVRYRFLDEPGMMHIGGCTTVNVSSGGVCFTTEKPLPLGVPIELSMNWPALLNNSCRMKLVLS